MSIKVPFKVKYGLNTIEIPVNGGKLYADNAPVGLSDLNSETFTIVNQIPESSGNAVKKAWIKHTLNKCCKQDGLYDKTNGGMVYKSNTWTVYVYNWKNYKKPLWTDGGYYSLPDEEKQISYTVNIGDLIIFTDISDDAPSSLQEFNALREKYKDSGGVVTGCEVYIRFEPDGTPWNTNHIEIVRG